jgi:hypothetical protein
MKWNEISSPSLLTPSRIQFHFTDHFQKKNWKGTTMCQGVHPAIRGEVWEFLLGCFDPGSTFDERDQIRERRRSIGEPHPFSSLLPYLPSFLN